MGTFSMLGVTTGISMALCFLYSALDLTYGEQGFLCWSAFVLLAVYLSGGLMYAAGSLAVLVGGKAVEHEPLVVLAVSLVASYSLYSHAFPAKVDDTPVPQRPYEQEIRAIVLRMDPSRLHLVDGELIRLQGREKELLARYQRELVEFEKKRATPKKSELQVAHEAETRRIEEAIRRRVEALTKRVQNRS